MHLSFTEFSFAEVRMQPKLTVGGQEDRVWGLGSCVEEVCSLCVCDVCNYYRMFCQLFIIDLAGLTRLTT